MPLVTVKNKYQVVIPQSLRDEIRLNVGDLLEAKVERGKITFTPKTLVDRQIAESLADFKAGRTFGPFTSHQELVSSLHQESARLRARKVTRRPKSA